MVRSAGELLSVHLFSNLRNPFSPKSHLSFLSPTGGIGCRKSSRPFLQGLLRQVGRRPPVDPLPPPLPLHVHRPPRPPRPPKWWLHDLTSFPPTSSSTPTSSPSTSPLATKSPSSSPPTSATPSRPTPSVLRTSTRSSSPPSSAPSYTSPSPSPDRALPPTSQPGSTRSRAASTLSSLPSPTASWTPRPGSWRPPPPIGPPARTRRMGFCRRPRPQIGLPRLCWRSWRECSWTPTGSGGASR